MQCGIVVCIILFHLFITFSYNVDYKFVRCLCSNCSLEHVANFQECWCCMEIDKCRDEMELADAAGCITSHPGYEEVCLNQFVLRAASVGLKTMSKISYLTMFQQGGTEVNE